MKTHRHASAVLPCPNLVLIMAQSPLPGGCSAIIVRSKSRSCSAVQPDILMADDGFNLREPVLVFISCRGPQRIVEIFEVDGSSCSCRNDG